MRNSQTQPTRSPQAQSMTARGDTRLQLFAVYSALALIAAIVFGTLSYRPF